MGVLLAPGFCTNIGADFYSAEVTTASRKAVALLSRRAG